MSVLNKPDIRAYIGASGSGKGVSVNDELKREKRPRLLIWDPRDEYADHAEAVRSLPELVARVSKAGRGPFRLRYVPGGAIDLAKAFGVVCRLAFAAKDLTFLAEELSDTTSGGYAPPAWRQVITQGRHQKLRVIGCAQRPALIDKTFLGNATYIRVFTLRYDDDRRAMAKALDIDQSRINALETTETDTRTVINYIERDFRAKVLRPGQIRLTR